MSFKSLLKKYVVLPALAYVEEEVLKNNDPGDRKQDSNRDKDSQNDQLEGVQTLRSRGRHSRAKNCTEANNCDG